MQVFTSGFHDNLEDVTFSLNPLFFYSVYCKNIGSGLTFSNTFGFASVLPLVSTDQFTLSTKSVHIEPTCEDFVQSTLLFGLIPVVGDGLSDFPTGTELCSIIASR